MVHKPKHRVHSFQGLLNDGGQDEINLERQNLNLAYRIIKFEVMSNHPGAVSTEDIVKVYKEKQSSIDGVVDFSDPDLLAAALWHDNNGSAYPISYQVIFGNKLFSRNIWVTASDIEGSFATNYYLELEEVPVGAATLMQLKLGVARKLDLKEGPYIPPD